ncbi:hypothetical protein AN1V17_47080 [Vallitalea sediminicola]
MSYKNKAEHEKEFVNHILSVGGIKTYGNTDEYGQTYWFFNLVNGERRYWTNLSDASQKALGISTE